MPVRNVGKECGIKQHYVTMADFFKGKMAFIFLLRVETENPKYGFWTLLGG